jgi:protein-tyrosine phosphatase
VALTSHFYPLREELEPYLKRRDKAYQALLSQWDANTMPSLKLGAEVRFSPQLTQMDLHLLTIGETGYLLLELPDFSVPAYVDQVVNAILKQGITPILAHVERCAYFRYDPSRLQELVQMGALAQVSATAFLNRQDRKFAEICLRNGLVHIIASDAHNIREYDPCLGKIAQELDENWIVRAEEFARAVWENTCPPAFIIHPVKKGLFGYC